MIGQYKIITLCGSTRFKDEFIKVQKELTAQGIIVVTVGMFVHSGDDVSEDTKIMLDDMHKHKIDMADGIYVINKDSYIGDSTKSEIMYALKKGKEIYFHEPQYNIFSMTIDAKELNSKVKPKHPSLYERLFGITPFKHCHCCGELLTLSNKMFTLFGAVDTFACSKCGHSFSIYDSKYKESQIMLSNK